MNTRIKFSQFNREGKGYMFLNDVRCYIEVWHSVVWQEDQLRVFYPKGMSCSYAAGKNITEWHFEDAYMWCKLPHKACIDTAITVVIAETNLRFFKGSRKWLTKEEEQLLQKERENRSLMEWLNPEMIQEIIPTLKDVDDSILWRYVDGSDAWVEWMSDPLNPAMVRKRVLEAYGAYQVYLDLDGDCEYHITRWDEDGVQDYPWAIFVGTRSECEAYVRDHE